jgi:hypothetical protein
MSSPRKTSSCRLSNGWATTPKPIVVGGPRLDCPTSASTIATRCPCAFSPLANQERNVVFPVSVAPSSRIAPAVRRSSSAFLQPGCALKLTTPHPFDSLEPHPWRSHAAAQTRRTHIPPFLLPYHASVMAYKSLLCIALLRIVPSMYSNSWGIPRKRFGSSMKKLPVRSIGSPHTGMRGRHEPSLDRRRGLAEYSHPSVQLRRAFGTLQGRRTLAVLRILRRDPDIRRARISSPMLLTNPLAHAL